MRLEDDAEAFHVDLAESVRGLANRLRPLTVVDRLLDTQDELDVLKREARRHVAKMISQSQDMLADAHLHLSNFQKMKRLMRAIEMRHARAAFKKWATYSAAEMESVEAKWKTPSVQLFLKSILTRSGTAAFYAWREEASRERLARIQALETKRQLREAEEALREAAARDAKMQLAVDRAQKQRLARIVASVFKRSMVTAFQAWVEAGAEQRELRVKLRRAVRKMTQRALSAAFARWSSVVREEKEMKVKVRRSLAKLLNRQLSSAFDAWHDAVAEAKEIRTKIKRSLAKMLNKAQSRAFDHWTGLVREKRDVRGKMLKIVARMANRKLAGSFQRWVEATEEAVEMRVKVKRSLGKMMHRQLAGAFDRWREAWEEAVDLRAKMRRVAGKIANNALASAFATWYDVVAEKRAASAAEEEQEAARRRILARVTGKIMHRKLAQPFDRWCEMVEEAKAMRVVLARAVGKMMRRQLAGAFERWFETWREASEQRAVVNRALRKLMNRQVSQAFDRWCEAWEEAAEMRLKLRRSLAKMINRRLSNAFEHWSGLVADKKHCELVIRRTLVKMVKRQLFAAFDRWVEAVEETKRMRRVVEKIARRWSRLDLSAAFEGWWQAMHDRKHKSFVVCPKCGFDARNPDGNLEMEEKRREALVRRAVKRMLNRVVADAFGRWREMWEEIAAQRAAVARAIGKMKYRQTAGAFHRWVEFTEETKDLRAKCLAITKRMLNRAIAGAFDAWKAFWEQVRWEKMMMFKAIRKMQNGILSKAWETWAFLVAERRRMEEVVRGMIARMRMRGVAAAFSTWADVVNEMRRQRRMVNDAIQRMWKRQLKLAWVAWYDNTLGLALNSERRAEEAERLAHERRMRVLARFIRKDMAAALATWREFVCEMKQIRHKIAGCVRRMAMRHLSGAFNTWAETWEEAVELRRKMQRAAQKMLNAKKSSAFAKWASVTREAIVERTREAYQLAGAAGRAAALSPALHIVRVRVVDVLARLESIWEDKFLSKERRAKLADLRHRIERLTAIIPTLSDIERAPYYALAGKARAAKLADAGGDRASVDDIGRSARDEAPVLPSTEEINETLETAAREVEAELLALAEAHSNAVKENLEARAAVAAAAADERKRQRALVGMIRRRIVTHLTESNDTMRNKLTVLTRHMENSKWVMAAAMDHMETLDAEEAVENVRGDTLELADAPDGVVTMPPRRALEGELLVKGLQAPRQSATLAAATADLQTTRAAHPMPRLSGRQPPGRPAEASQSQRRGGAQGGAQPAPRAPPPLPSANALPNGARVSSNGDVVVTVTQRPATANPEVGARARRHSDTSSPIPPSHPFPDDDDGEGIDEADEDADAVDHDTQQFSAAVQSLRGLSARRRSTGGWGAAPRERPRTSGAAAPGRSNGPAFGVSLLPHPPIPARGEQADDSGGGNGSAMVANGGRPPQVRAMSGRNGFQTVGVAPPSTLTLEIHPRESLAPAPPRGSGAAAVRAAGSGSNGHRNANGHAANGHASGGVGFSLNAQRPQTAAAATRRFSHSGGTGRLAADPDFSATLVNRGFEHAVAWSSGRGEESGRKDIGFAQVRTSVGAPRVKPSGVRAFSGREAAR